MARLENGLPADDWLMLADVESPFTEHVLESLAVEGIAAYAEPSTSPESTYLGAGRSSGPSDCVMVDRRYRSQARAVLAGLLPQLRAELAEDRRRAEDHTWQQIVNGLSQEGVGQRVLQGQDEDTDVETDGSAAADPDAQWDDVRGEAAAAAAVEGIDDDVEHYVPPEPPPLPAADTVTRFAWVGLVAGPLFLVLGTLLGWPIDGFAALLAVGAFVAGFVTLVARMKDDRSSDDAGDDGAVV
jgi:hypothetical protein